MGIAEILARKKALASTPSPIIEKDKDIVRASPPGSPYNPPPVLEGSDDIEDLKFGIVTGDKYLPSYKKDLLFISFYSLLIKYPYLLYADYLPLREFILKDHVYVLNTFAPLNQQKIFELYMIHNPPRSAHELHKLYCSISSICLSVPGYYQKDVEDIISGNFSIDNFRSSL